MFRSVNYKEPYFLLLICCLQVISGSENGGTTNVPENTTRPEPEDAISGYAFQIMVVTLLAVLILIGIIIICQNAFGTSSVDRFTSHATFEDPYEDLPSFMVNDLKRDTIEKPQTSKRSTTDRCSLATLLSENEQVDPMREHRRELHRLLDQSPLNVELKSEMRASQKARSRTQQWHVEPQRTSESTYCVAPNNTPSLPQPEAYPRIPNSEEPRRAVWRPALPGARISVLERIKNRISKNLGQPQNGIAELSADAERLGLAGRNHHDRIYTKDNSHQYRSRYGDSNYSRGCECNCQATKARGHSNTFDPYVMEDPPESEEGHWQNYNVSHASHRMYPHDDRGLDRNRAVDRNIERTPERDRGRTLERSVTTDHTRTYVRGTDRKIDLNAERSTGRTLDRDTNRTLDKSASMDKTLDRDVNRTRDRSASVDRTLDRGVNRNFDRSENVDRTFDRDVNRTLDRSASVDRTLDRDVNRTLDRSASVDRTLDRDVNRTLDRSASVDRTLDRDVNRTLDRSAGVDRTLDRDVNRTLDRSASVDRTLDRDAIRCGTSDRNADRSLDRPLNMNANNNIGRTLDTNAERGPDRTQLIRDLKKLQTQERVDYDDVETPDANKQQWGVHLNPTRQRYVDHPLPKPPIPVNRENLDEIANTLVSFKSFKKEDPVEGSSELPSPNLSTRSEPNATMPIAPPPRDYGRQAALQKQKFGY